MEFIKLFFILLLIFIIYKYYRKKETSNQSSKLSKVIEDTVQGNNAKKELHIDDQNEIKIGTLVRSTFPKLIENNLLNKDEINKLLTYEYSKREFDLNYPFLKKVDIGKPIKENLLEIDYIRYYATPYKIDNEKYLLTNDWFERNKSFYTHWLKIISKR